LTLQAMPGIGVTGAGLGIASSGFGEQPARCVADEVGCGLRGGCRRICRYTGV